MIDNFLKVWLKKKNTPKKYFYGCFCKPLYSAWFDEGRIVEKLDQHNANWIHLGNKKLNSHLRSSFSVLNFGSCPITWLISSWEENKFCYKVSKMITISLKIVEVVILNIKVVILSDAQLSVQPKPGFGIGNQNQGPISVSVSEPKLFFQKPKFLIFKIFFWRYGFIFKLIKTYIPPKVENIRNIKKNWKQNKTKTKEIRFRKKKIGSDTDTEIGPWGRLPIPKPGFSRTIGGIGNVNDTQIFPYNTKEIPLPMSTRGRWSIVGKIWSSYLKNGLLCILAAV